MGTSRQLLADTRGASSAEYALLLGVIGASLVWASLALAESVACSIKESAYAISGKAPASPGNSDPGGNAFGHDCR